MGSDPARLVRRFVLLTWAAAVAWLAWIASSSLSPASSAGGERASVRHVRGAHGGPEPPRTAGDVRRGSQGPEGRAADFGSTARTEEGAPEPAESRGREDPAAAAKEDGRGGDANDRPREAARSRYDVAGAQAAPREPEAGQTPTGADADDMRIARDVPGASLSVPSPVEGDGPVLAVYADAPATEPVKGLVLLLHACTHSAYKFFARSGRCEECVGLSEEMRIARIALRNGYLPVAVSSADRDTGCWSKGRDAERVRAALDADFLRRYRDLSVVAVGASSGGALAAELALGGLADGALVMVMDLTDGTVGRLKDAGGSVPVYYAPMPRDAARLRRVVRNYDRGPRTGVRLDQSSCAPLPLTADYLVGRVVGMDRAEAGGLIDALVRSKHVHERSRMFLKDPTVSDWRDVLTSGQADKTRWLGKYALERGKSPLAKALHRCWAFHEYCSESVEPALRFFEARRKQ